MFAGIKPRLWVYSVGVAGVLKRLPPDTFDLWMGEWVRGCVFGWACLCVCLFVYARVRVCCLIAVITLHLHFHFALVQCVGI